VNVGDDLSAIFMRRGYFPRHFVEAQGSVPAISTVASSATLSATSARASATSSPAMGWASAGDIAISLSVPASAGLPQPSGPSINSGWPKRRKLVTQLRFILWMNLYRQQLWATVVQSALELTVDIHECS
jgi:hypothetical protein